MSDGSHVDDTTTSAGDTGAPGDGTATEKKPGDTLVSGVVAPAWLVLPIHVPSALTV